MVEFDIIRYLSGLTGFVFDKAVLERVALDRGVENVQSVKELDDKTKDLLRADLFYVMYTSPNTTASSTKQHGAYSHTVGSQTIYDRKWIYNTFMTIYHKYDDKKLETVDSDEGGLQWINEEE